jgi:hypothetical protein
MNGQQSFQHLPRNSTKELQIQQLYLPNQNTVKNEAFTLWEGQLSFKQYIPLTGAKFSIKLLELCEYNTVYV